MTSRWVTCRALISPNHRRCVMSVHRCQRGIVWCWSSIEVWDIALANQLFAPCFKQSKTQTQLHQGFQSKNHDDCKMIFASLSNVFDRADEHCSLCSHWRALNNERFACNGYIKVNRRRLWRLWILKIFSTACYCSVWNYWTAFFSDLLSHVYERYRYIDHILHSAVHCKTYKVTSFNIKSNKIVEIKDLFTVYPFANG